jgi:putative mRNA 3-end processing factor
MSTIDWIHLTPNGFHCTPGNFFLDPHRPAARAVISHAHGDHYPRMMGQVWCTPPTLALAKARYGHNAAKTSDTAAFGEEFSIGEVQVKFLPAGHILGSAQILLRYRDETVLYSGDFSLHANPTCTPLSYPDEPIDLLICESTFGEKPVHGHAPTELARVLEAARTRPLLIGTYPLGKAQHINHMIAKLAPEMPVFVHFEMMKFHKVYRQFEMNPGEAVPYRRTLAKRSPKPYAYLVPPRILTSYVRDQDHYKVFASGWTTGPKKPYLDDRLDFSDHADATEIMDYIGKIAPKEVWFWHGYPKPLIQACKALGIGASEASVKVEN